MSAYVNFCKTLNNLKQIYDCEEPYDIVHLMGIVGLFKLCYDESLKMLKEVLEEYGYSKSKTYYGKTLLKTAYKAEIIKDEEAWLSAIWARKNYLNCYNQKIALEIAKLAKERFYDMFVELKAEIDKNWITM